MSVTFPQNVQSYYAIYRVWYQFSWIIVMENSPKQFQLSENKLYESENILNSYIFFKCQVRATIYFSFTYIPFYQSVFHWNLNLKLSEVTSGWNWFCNFRVKSKRSNVYTQKMQTNANEAAILLIMLWKSRTLTVVHHTD